MTKIIGQERSAVGRKYPSVLLGSTALTLSLIAGVALPVQQAFAQVIESSVGGETAGVVNVVGFEERSDQTIRNTVERWGNAVYLSGANAELVGDNLTIETQGSSPSAGTGTGSLSVGVRAVGGAKVSLTGGSVSATGAQYGRGILGSGADTKIATDGTAISTLGNNSHGVHVFSAAEATILGGTVSTLGSDSFGFYSQNADSALTARNVTVTTGGTNGFGAFAYGGGVVHLTDGSITTSGEKGHGAVAGLNSSIELEGTDIVTNGPNAWGLVADQANTSINATGVTIVTEGAGSGGLLAGGSGSGAISFVDGNVTVRGADVEAARVLNGSTLSMVNSSLVSAHGAGVVLADNATVTLDGTSVSAGKETFVSNLNSAGQTQDITVQGASVATQNNGTLLRVNRTTDGANGVVNLVLDAGSTTQGDIYDEDGRSGSGATNVWVDAQASWIGRLFGVQNFSGGSGGEVSFEGEANIAGDLSGEGTTYTFSEQGGQIGGDVALTQGSTTTGGSISTPITVVGDVAVDDTSVFGGNWNIDGNLDSSGVITPGNSIGVVTVGGNLTFAPTSRYDVELNAAGEADRINVTGTAFLDGSVTVAPIDYFRLGYDYTILTAAGFAGTSFDSVALVDDYAFITPILAQDDAAGTVSVRVERNGVSYASVAQTSNQAAVAAAADTLPVSSAIGGSLAVTTVAGAQMAFDQLSGEAYASAQSALVDASHVTAGAINNRILHSSSLSDTGTGVWMNGYHARASLNGNGNAADADYSSSGVLVGVDGQLTPDVFAGVVAGYGRTDIDAAYGSSVDSTNYLLGLYGGTNWGDVAFRGGLINTWHDIGAKRSVGFASFADALDATYNARTFQAFGELGYGIEMGAALFEPFVNLSHIRHSSDSFVESGGASALAVDGASLNTTFTTIGLRASTELTAGTVPVSLHGMVGWRHAFGDVTPNTNAGFAGASGFSVDGTTLARDGAVIEAGLDFNLNPASGPGVANLGVTYSGAFGNNTSSHGVRLGLNVEF